MPTTVSDFIVQRLAEWGVQRVFGYPGDGINGVMTALAAKKDQIAFVQVRHEEMAAFMATGHAKFTGQPGVCIATSGPGAIHLLNGLYDAKMDHQPVVAIVGQQATTVLGGHFQQEVDLLSLFKDVAGDYVHMCTDAMQIRHLVDRAMRIAVSKRTVTCVIVPNDIQAMEYKEPKHVHASVHTSAGFIPAAMVPPQDALEKAAAILNEGKKVAILVGAGAKHAAEEVMEVAGLLGAGVAKALLGKAVLPDDLPYVTGAIGLLGTKPSWELMEECDTLLMIGSDFPYAEFLPAEGQARGIQIDIDGSMLGIRYPMELNLQGDSKQTLRALMPLLKRKEDRRWRNKIETSVEKWWQLLEKRAMNEANPINPQRVFWELSKRLPEDCILTGDSGSTASWYARHIKIKKGMMASLSGSLATMCPSIPYGIAAKFAYPGRPVVAISGDGAMQMLGMNELITIAKYWQQWDSPQFIVLVSNNQDLNMVSWEQRVMDGAPKFEGSQDIPDFPFARYASLLGLEGIRVEKPDQIADALDMAFAARRPVVLDVLTDPSVPMMPPHITYTQRKNFFSAIAKGDVDAWNMIKQTYREVTD